MKATSTWSYHPYRPLLADVGDIYICRVAPAETAILLEWLPCGGPYTVFYKKREEPDFIRFGETAEPVCEIAGLCPDTDYAFYVTAGEKKSRVRLARCGKSVGTVVNYLHPDDACYAFSGRYLCSPSLVRLPDGALLASMDVYAHAHPQNLTLIFRSEDDGATWHHLSELMPCFWGSLFLHKGALYMLSCSTEYGDLQIGRSDDGGRTFSAPVALLRGSNGKNGSCGAHRNPQNILSHNGRLYASLEWGAWANKDFGHAAMMMSCDENADLLGPASWHFTPPMRFDAFAPELEGLPQNTMTIEGTPVLAPDGRLLNVMRFGKYQKALCYEVDTTDPDAPLTYAGLMDFPANYSKFMIKTDPVTGDYYSIGTRVYDPEHTSARDLLSLLRSRDLVHWEVVCDLLDYRGIDQKHIGFQYVSFLIEGDDILYLCRTALNGAHSYHDSNYSTFHRIKDFRKL